jgi:hypothetical protein
MTTVVRVQLHNIDLQDSPTLERLARFDNASFSQVDDLAFMTVYVDPGQSVVDVVLETVRKLSAKVPGVDAVRVHPDLVTTSDIANRVGVSREAVRKWVGGSTKPFPTQFANISSEHQRVWRWVEVVQWLLKAKAIDMDEDLPSLEDIAHIDACLNRVPDVATHEWEALTQAEVPLVEFSSVGPRDIAATIDIALYRRIRNHMGNVTRVG